MDFHVVLNMFILAFLLLIISLSKLFLAISLSNQVEVKKLIDNLSIPIDTLSISILAIIVADGLIGLICSLFILVI